MTKNFTDKVTNIYMYYIRQQMGCDKHTIMQQVKKEREKKIKSSNRRGVRHCEIDIDLSRIKTVFPVRRKPFKKREFLLAKISVIDS